MPPPAVLTLLTERGVCKAGLPGFWLRPHARLPRRSRARRAGRHGDHEWTRGDRARNEPLQMLPNV